MYELLVKGGELIDPAQGIRGQRDIGISQGKVMAVETNIDLGEAKRVLDAKGKIVTPGLIDMHSHGSHIIIEEGAPPDEIGVYSGVTTLSDAGSTGWANFPGFKKFIISQAKTDIFCFLHMASSGISFLPELWDWRNIDTKAMMKVIEQNRDTIKGVYLRSNGPVVESLNIEAVKAAKRVALEAGLPLMIHIGREAGETASDDIMAAYTPKMLLLLDKGDILTHVFTPKAGGVIKSDGTVLPELKEAMERGVIFDVATADDSLNFEIARKGMEQGIMPNTLSTDITLHTRNSRGILSLIVTMSKFLALGLSLAQVVEMTTINPARALREEHSRGTLKVGMPADISVLRLEKGDYTFYDTDEEENPLKSKQLLVPEIVLKDGEEIAAVSRYR